MPTIYVALKGDSRKVGRDLKSAEARVSDLDRPSRAADIRRILDPATVARKALGELDRGV